MTISLKVTKILSRGISSTGNSLKGTPLGQVEFPLFPHKLWRPNHPILEQKLDSTKWKDPWTKREAWRNHSYFSVKNRSRNMFPGLGIATIAFTAYVLFDQWYITYGPAREETLYWSNWMKKRQEQLAHDHH